MKRLAGLLLLVMPGLALTQELVTYRAAVVALTDDPPLRVSFEDGLSARLREHRYDVTSTYEIEPDVDALDSRRFLRTLASNGVQAVLMLRPAAVGPGSSLESVRSQVSDELLRDMRAFAQEVSSSGGENLIAVVHMAVYVFRDGDPQLISAGAVWLDEEVESREQGIERLQDLIVANVDAARPVMRQRLGLPPL